MHLKIVCLIILLTGILLWEIFSLGQVPYPGIEAGTELYQKIRDGYRMDKPHLASQEIFDIMISCWNVNPETRPLFDALEQNLSSLLDESVKDVSEIEIQQNLQNFNLIAIQLYLKLEISYLTLNNRRTSGRSETYLISNSTNYNKIVPV